MTEKIINTGYFSLIYILKQFLCQNEAYDFDEQARKNIFDYIKMIY
jgi:hypothetical protein